MFLARLIMPLAASSIQFILWPQRLYNVCILSSLLTLEKRLNFSLALPPSTSN
jgi:hypothetical protein